MKRCTLKQVQLRIVVRLTLNSESSQGEDQLLILVGIAILLMLFGLLALIWPRAAWYIGEGWQYSNVEPSSCLMISIRIGGLIFIGIGIALMLFSVNA